MSRPRKLADDGSGAPAMNKRDCILAAAREIFLEMGYGAASMDAVAARATVSKATIYAHFANKRDLFEQVLHGRCQHVFDLAELALHEGDTRSVLRSLARDLFSVVISPEAVAINRVVIAEAARQPEVGEVFYTAGPSRGINRITRIFNDLSAHGLLLMPVDEAPLVAELFLNMLKGDVHTRQLLGVPPSRSDHQTLLDLAVDLILARYAPDAKRQAKPARDNLQSAASLALNR